MKNKIKWILKGSKTAYFLYNRILSTLLRFWGLFLRIDKKLILVNSYGGAKYNDNTKAIYEYIQNNPKYNSYKIIWSFNKLPENAPKNIVWVKNNSISFFKTALKAKYWITNSSMERGLKFKKNKTIYINTHHGSVIKKIDKSNDRMAFRVSRPNYVYAQSQIDVDYFTEKWDLPKGVLQLSGYPRNDTLAKVTNKEIKAIKEKLKLPADKKIILYAPTYRDNDYDKNGCYIAPPMDIEKWRKILSNDYILIFRAHYEISKSLNIKKNDSFVKDYTNYEDVNDLLKVSDILISDYSSIIIDYSILERPIFCFAYDYDKYIKERGTAYDLKKELPNGITTNEDELISAIKNCNYKLQTEKTRKFKNKHVEVYGNASAYIDKIILEKG